MPATARLLITVPRRHHRQFQDASILDSALVDAIAKSSTTWGTTRTQKLILDFTRAGPLSPRAWACYTLRKKSAAIRAGGALRPAKELVMVFEITRQTS